MRRNALRFALAIVATSFLAACADLSTGPNAPSGPRFDEGGPSTSTDTISTPNRASNHQGSQT